MSVRSAAWRYLAVNHFFQDPTGGEGGVMARLTHKQIIRVCKRIMDKYMYNVEAKTKT